MNPYDFTLYSAEDGSRVMKVMFSEGEYKVDIGRYFLITEDEDATDSSIDQLKLLADRIRNTYPEPGFTEITKGDIAIIN
ncbi:hypothetical protein J3E61_002848 [Mycobacterium sp. OAE908]